MPTIEQARRLAARRTREDGLVVDSALPDRLPLYGSVGEVKSLTPARVEILSGRTIPVDAYLGPVPAVGDLVLVVEVAQLRAVITGIEVV